MSDNTSMGQPPAEPAVLPQTMKALQIIGVERAQLTVQPIPERDPVRCLSK